MTVCVSSDEVTGREAPGARSSRANAFRVLSVSADAEPRQIDKQQARLLLALELDPSKVDGACGLKRLSREEVPEAAGVLARPESRLLEELFWVHDMDCGELREGPSTDALNLLRETDGAVARHNLAVLLTIRAQESAPAAWEEALSVWRKVLEDETFWNFIQGRELLLQCKRKAGVPKLKAVVCQQVSATLARQLVLAGRGSDVKAATSLVRMVLPHREWLDLDAALTSVGEQVTKDGFVSLGAVLDRLREARQDDGTAIGRVLAQGETELGRIVTDYGEFIHLLGEMPFINTWEDAVSRAYDQKEAMQRDWQQIRWSVLYREASALLKAGDYAAAERKLGDARVFSTHEQEERIAALLQDCQFARVAADRQLRLEKRQRLCQEARAWMQKGYFDAAEQELAMAMQFSIAEEAAEIEALWETCSWMRVLHGLDTSCARPTPFRIAGIGTIFLDRRNYDPATKSYLASLWFTFLFVPAYPLGVYRISHDGSVQGKASLPRRLRMARWTMVAVALALVLAAVLLIGFRTKRHVSDTTTQPQAKATETPVPSTSDQSAPVTDAVPFLPSGDLERERAAIAALGKSLEERKSALQMEKAELHKQAAYLQGVAVNYRAEAVPQSGQTVYDAILADYNRRVNQHNRKLAQWGRDAAAYHDRVRAFNARVGVFNRIR